MTRPLGVVVIGLGNIGRIHISAFGEIEESSLIGVFDEDHELAEKAIRDSGMSLKAYKSLTEVLGDAHVDVVSICTPTGSHLEIAKAALASGKHVVIEKPIDVDISAARDFVSLAQGAKPTTVHIVSQHRFDPSSQIVRDLLDRGAFGTITTAIASIAWWRDQSYYDSADWRGTWAQDGGGALLNQGVHTLDLLLACMGKPRRIYAEAKILAHQGIEVEDALVATIEFESGSLASLHATTNAYPGVETSLQIFGTKGSAQIVNDELSFIHIEDPRQPVGPFGINGRGNQRDAYVHFENRGRLDATEDHVPHLRQLKQIVVAIQNGALSEVQPQDAYVALATIRAAYVSSQLGRPLDLSQIIEGEYDDLAINFETAHQSETGSPNHG